MSPLDPHLVRDEEALRAVVGEALPGVETEILNRLDAPTRAALENAPCLALVASWGERHRVSLDAIFAERAGAGDAAAREIDDAIDADDRNKL